MRRDWFYWGFMAAVAVALVVVVARQDMAALQAMVKDPSGPAEQPTMIQR